MIKTENKLYKVLKDDQVDGLYEVASQILLDTRKAAKNDNNLTDFISDQTETLRLFMMSVIGAYQSRTAEYAKIQKSFKKAQERIIADNKK
jgi:hypothetical protein